MSTKLNSQKLNSWSQEEIDSFFVQHFDYEDAAKVYFNDVVNDKSISALSSTLPVFRHHIVSLLAYTYVRSGMKYVAYKGFRSLEEQEVEWRKGREGDRITNPRLVTTHRKPGTSAHQFGLAVDLYALVAPEENIWAAKHFMPLMNAVQSPEFSPYLRLAGSKFELGHVEINLSLLQMKAAYADSKKVAT